MHVEQLVETAVARTGSDDFGGDTWREGLEVLVGSLSRRIVRSTNWARAP